MAQQREFATLGSRGEAHSRDSKDLLTLVSLALTACQSMHGATVPGLQYGILRVLV